MEKKSNICKAELNIMEVLWTQGEMPAGRLYRILQDKIKWKKSTTYTVLGKCIDKGFVERIDPRYVCRALVSQKEIEHRAIEETADLYFGGSKISLFSLFLKNAGLTAEEIQTLEDMLEHRNEDIPSLA